MKNFGGWCVMRPAWLAGVSAILCVLAFAAEPAFAARHHRAKTSELSAEEAAAEKNTLVGPYQEALLMEPVSGTVIFAKNEHQPWPTASLAKMMLMEIVAEKLDDGSLKLSDKIVTSRKADKMGGFAI